MGFMDNVSAFTKGVGQKAKGNYDVVAMTTQINGMQKDMKGIYEQLGEKYYALHKEDAEDALSGLVKELVDLEKKIQDTKEQIEDTKQKTAEVSLTVAAPVVKIERKCQECGALLQEGDIFCNACGTKYEPPVVAETVVAPTPVAPVSEAKTCPNCGSNLEADAVFCSECGTKVQ